MYESRGASDALDLDRDRGRDDVDRARLAADDRDDVGDRDCDVCRLREILSSRCR